ncbi:ribosomal biogenesis protein [Vulcanisaeta distributa]|uniref:ribosomal biogenesis protein n=1 Tax=Vulcanisaeta distributa TaxID=164451 RepID=UPI000B013744|nr:ribosomal biogenesis protein [Vulcanisaeta distributa]
MRQFLNELELVIPNAVKVNRGGKSSIIEIAGKALSLGGANKILYIGSRGGGNPGFMRFLRVREGGVIEVMPYLIRILGVKLLMDMPVNVTRRLKASSGIIISLKEYTEVMDVLSEYLGLPSIRLMTSKVLGGVCMTRFS